MNKDWRDESRTSTDEFIGVLTAHNHHGESTRHVRKRIPKSDGRQRPLGIAALEDKIVQQAVLTVLEQIYEEDFVGFSYALAHVAWFPAGEERP
jgi:RNA-directed DNA polymerase